MTEPTAADFADAARRLEEGAEAIERDGWYQGSYAPEPPIHPKFHGESVIGKPRCALGSMENGLRWSHVLQDWVGHRTKNALARRMLAATLGLPDQRDIPDWNDAPDRTKQEVLDALHLAAKQSQICAEEVGS